MKNTLSKSKSILKNLHANLLWFLFVLPGLSQANLPTAPKLEGVDQGDYIGAGLALFTKVAKGSITLLYFACGVSFIAVMYFKFNDAKKSNEWGNFALVFAIGLILLVITLIILNAIKGALG